MVSKFLKSFFKVSCQLRLSKTTTTTKSCWNPTFIRMSEISQKNFKFRIIMGYRKDNSYCLLNHKLPMVFPKKWTWATIWRADHDSSPHITSGSIPFSSVAQSCPTLWDPMDCSPPGFPVHHRSLFKLMSIESVIPSNHLILCCSLLLLSSIFPSIRSFPMSLFLASGSQSFGSSASSSVLPMNIQDWFPLQMTGLISLQSKGLSRVFSNTTVQKHQFFGAQLCL